MVKIENYFEKDADGNIVDLIRGSPTIGRMREGFRKGYTYGIANKYEQANYLKLKAEKLLQEREGGDW